MKYLSFILLSALTALTSFSQKRGFDNLGIGFETGGGMDYADDVITVNSLTRNVSAPSAGVTLFYEHQFNFGKRSSLILGGGLNATLFSSHLYYRNPDLPYLLQTSQASYPVFLPAAEHDLGKASHSFYAIDIPIYYSYTFKAGEKWNIGAYTGFKFRNVSYIYNEQRNTSVSRTAFEGTAEDTAFYMNYTYNKGMRASRIVPYFVFGVKASKLLKNEGRINFFADVNLSLGNNVEVYYRNFKNTETISTQVERDGETYPVTQKYNVNFSDNNSLYMALKMSHLKIGISYTLPGKP